MLLYKGGTVSSLLVSRPNENGLTFARDEHILFVVYWQSMFGEDGYRTGVYCLAHAHEQVWEVIKRIYFPWRPWIIVGWVTPWHGAHG